MNVFACDLFLMNKKKINLTMLLNNTNGDCRRGSKCIGQNQQKKQAFRDL